MISLSDLIRSDAPISTGATAVYPYKPVLEKKYRFVSRFDDEVELFRREGDLIHLPRALCPVGPNDHRDPGLTVSFPKAPVPRPNQVKIFAETAAFLKHGHSGLVSAYTGWGKTYLGYYAAWVVQKKTIVITTKDDIYKQWLKDAPTVLGIPEHEVGEIRGDKCEVVGTKFIVAMIHSLSKAGKYPPHILKLIREGVGLVIFDECHRVPADQFAAVIEMFPAKLRLGLSATIERSDGKELVLAAHIGPVRAQTEAELLVPKVLRVRTAWDCPRVLRSNKETGEKKVVMLPHEAGKTTHIEKIIAADPVRNRQIADIVKDVYDKGRQVVIFSTLIEHLHSLQRAYVELGIPGKDIGLYVGASTKAEIAHREKVKVRPVINTTFSMMSEGTNLPWLDTCLLAMPRSRVTQPVGRIRREYEGKALPVVIDMLDLDSPVFSGYASNRMAWYKSLGCEIVEIN